MQRKESVFRKFEATEVDEECKDGVRDFSEHKEPRSVQLVTVPTGDGIVRVGRMAKLYLYSMKPLAYLSWAVWIQFAV